MSVTTARSYCRFRRAYCAIEVNVDDGRVVAVRGDTSDPIYAGYTRIKGRQLPDRHNGAERLQAIIRERGPRAIASYCGSYAIQNSAALAVSRAVSDTWGLTRRS